MSVFFVGIREHVDHAAWGKFVAVDWRSNEVPAAYRCSYCPSSDVLFHRGRHAIAVEDELGTVFEDEVGGVGVGEVFDL